MVVIRQYISPLSAHTSAKHPKDLVGMEAVAKAEWEKICCDRAALIPFFAGMGARMCEVIQKSGGAIRR